MAVADTKVSLFKDHFEIKVTLKKNHEAGQRPTTGRWFLRDYFLAEKIFSKVFRLFESYVFLKMKFQSIYYFFENIVWKCMGLDRLHDLILFISGLYGQVNTIDTLKI